MVIWGDADEVGEQLTSVIDLGAEGITCSLPGVGHIPERVELLGAVAREGGGRLTGHRGDPAVDVVGQAEQRLLAIAGKRRTMHERKSLDVEIGQCAYVCCTVGSERPRVEHVLGGTRPGRRCRRR